MKQLLAAVLSLLLVSDTYCQPKELVSRNYSHPCSRLSAPPNGRVWHRRQQNQTTYAAVFTCNTGYVLSGHNISHCQAGTWIPPDIPSCSQAIGQECSPNVNNPSNQELGVPIQKSNLGPGNSITLKCSVQGVWQKDGNILRQTALPVGHSLLPDGSLRVNYTESGLLPENIYLCLSFGTDFVKLLSVAMIHPERCREESVTVQENHSIILGCSDELVHTLGYWSRTDRQMNERHQVSSNGNLHILSASFEDEGLYICRISKQCRLVKLKVRTAEATCGIPRALVRQRRIIDGVKAPEGSVPWMGMISSDKNPVVCGCTLISDRWVLTAAHCLTAARNDDDDIPMVLTGNQVKERFHIKLGKHLRRQQEPGQTVSRIKEVYIHPDFIPRSHDGHFQTVNENDIALLKLSTPLMFSSAVSPICLPVPGFLDSLNADTLGLVTGWGRVSVRQSVTAYTLQEARLPLVNRETCAKASSPYQITDKMLCAGYAESYRPDTCDGDSGGPYSMQGNDGRWRLIGIVSWGQGCSSPGKFGIYTHVEKYLDWIMHTIKT